MSFKITSKRRLFLIIFFFAVFIYLIKLINNDRKIIYKLHETNESPRNIRNDIKVKSKFYEFDEDFEEIIKKFYNLNAFFIDFDYLNVILKYEKTLNDTTYYFDTINDNYKILNNENKKTLNFGIRVEYNQNISELIENLNESLKNQNCKVSSSMGSYKNLLIITSLFINCKNDINIYLSLFYKRGDFYWIGKDSNNDDNNKWFGDTPRGINQFDLITLIDSSNLKINLPFPIKQFLFDYKNSKFLECDFELSKIHEDAVKKNMNKVNHILKSLNYLTKNLERMQKHYSLIEGSLLGWYRDCSIIPFTTDADIGLWAEEFEQKIIDFFHNNEKLRLLLSFGRPESGYELRFHDGSFQFDAFYIYKHNKTHQSLAYYEGKYVSQQYVEYFDLCSGEIHGSKFLVPCDPVTYLNNDYENWKSPKSKGYTWLNVDFKNKREYLYGDPITYYQKSESIIQNIENNYITYNFFVFFCFMVICLISLVALLFICFKIFK